MIGRRVTWPEGKIPVEIEHGMQPGDYAGDYHGLWLLRAPNGDWGSISSHSGHTITIHDDGTITVAPSIQFNTGGRWHGYLERGVWRSA